MERPGGEAGREVTVVTGIVTLRREVARDVGRAGGHRNRIREAHLLPARSRLTGERRPREQLSRRRPQVADVGAVVAGPLEEPDAGDRAVGGGLEAHAQLHRSRVGGDRVHQWCVRWRPERAGACDTGDRERPGQRGHRVPRRVGSVAQRRGVRRPRNQRCRRIEGDGPRRSVIAHRRRHRATRPRQRERDRTRHHGFVEPSGHVRIDADTGGAGYRRPLQDDRCAGVTRRWGRVEDRIHPVVRRVTRHVGRIRARRAVPVHPVATFARGERVERPVGDPAEQEVAAVPRVVALRREVAGDVRRARRHRHGVREGRLLPARCRLTGEGGLRQELSGRSPQAPQVRPAVPRALVEAHRGDPPVGHAPEFHPELDGVRVVRGRVCRAGRRGPECARTGGTTGGERPGRRRHRVAGSVRRSAQRRGVLRTPVQRRRRIERGGARRAVVADRARDRTFGPRQGERDGACDHGLVELGSQVRFEVDCRTPGRGRLLHHRWRRGVGARGSGREHRIDPVVRRRARNGGGETARGPVPVDAVPVLHDRERVEWSPCSPVEEERVPVAPRSGPGARSS